MTSGFKFTRLTQLDSDVVTLTIDGQKVSAKEGDSVAAAILINDGMSTRTTAVSGSSRGPYCMMGACFECLVQVDGVANQQACMIRVTEGMVVARQIGAPKLAKDP